MQIGSQFLGTFAFDEEPFDWGNDSARTPYHLKVKSAFMFEPSFRERCATFPELQLYAIEFTHCTRRLPGS
eukprot:415453-Pelagomonas_calceolata.AAC.5